MYNAAERYFDDFLGKQLQLVLATNTGTPWAAMLDKTNASPTVAGATNFANGAVALTLDNTNEAQGAQLYHGDVCSFKADNLQTVTFRLNTAANITTAQALVWGMISARNADPDNTSYNVQFKLAASTAVVVETDDDSTNDDDNATAATLGTTMKEFMVDFRQGFSDIRFFAGNASGRMDRLAPKTTFAAAALTGKYLQPSVFLLKTGGTTTPIAYVDYVEILYRRS